MVGSRWSSVLPAILLLTLSAVLIAILYKITESQIIIAVIGFSTAIVTASFQYRAAKDRETEARLFSEKRSVYVELIELIMGMFGKEHANESNSEQSDLVAKLRKIRTQLLIWGHADTVLVLDSLGSRMPTDVNSITDQDKVALLTIWMGDMFKAIRRDLGHKDDVSSAVEMALGVLNEPDRTAIRRHLNSMKKSK